MWFELNALEPRVLSRHMKTYLFLKMQKEHEKMYIIPPITTGKTNILLCWNEIKFILETRGYETEIRGQIPVNDTQ